MIYFFTGNNSYAIASELEKWKNKFLQTLGDFNFFHLKEIHEIPKGSIQEIMTAPSFMGQKKLVFIQLTGVKEEAIHEDFLLSLLGNIPEENIILFYTNTLKEKNTFHQQLLKEGKHTDFSLPENIFSQAEFLHKKYPNIGKKEITRILELKSGNMNTALHEIEKILLFSQNPTIQDIQEHIIAEPEESIFQFINTLLNGSFGDVHTSFTKIQNQMDFYLFYHMLLGSLRSVVFIEYMKSQHISASKIDVLLKLGKKSFLIQKRYKLSSQKIKNLYISLISFDKKIKTGYTIGSQEEELFNELESIFIQSF